MHAELIKEFLTKLGYAFFGAADGMLYALIIMVILDYITGVCVAIHNKKLSSSVGAKGIAKKVMLFALVSLSHIIDQYLMRSADVLRIVTTTFYLANEGISIIENAGSMGIPIPSKLKDIIAHFKTQNKGEK